MITAALLERIRSQYRLDWQGMHGAGHWARVRINGLRLAESTGADIRVVEAFAFLHDSCRWSDGNDLDHGPRAADFAAEINDEVLGLDHPALMDLQEACTFHTCGGITHASVTVLTCWDADRLDLGRVGRMPRAEYLCTDVARDPEMIRWAYARSLGEEPEP